MDFGTLRLAPPEWSLVSFVVLGLVLAADCGFSNNGPPAMIGSPKEWASLLAFDRDTDEKTMAARARVLGKTLAYLNDHFSDPEGARPPEEVIVELGQFLVLAEAMESKARSVKFKELYDTVIALHLQWDEADRDEAFRELERKAAVLKGILAFADAWLGTVTPIPSRRPPPQGDATREETDFDASDVKTRLVRPSHLVR